MYSVILCILLNAVLHSTLVYCIHFFLVSYHCTGMWLYTVKYRILTSACSACVMLAFAMLGWRMLACRILDVNYPHGSFTNESTNVSPCEGLASTILWQREGVKTEVKTKVITPTRCKMSKDKNFFFAERENVNCRTCHRVECYGFCISTLHRSRC